MRPILRKRDSGAPDDTLVIAPAAPRVPDPVRASDSASAITEAVGLPGTPPSGQPPAAPAGQQPAAPAGQPPAAPAGQPPAAPAGQPPAATAPAAAPDGELAAQRDRLIERFALMQCELGGLFYEMAIRDHVRMDVLVERAAALQRLDVELGQIERMLETGSSTAGGTCPSCGAIYARAAAFCAQCAHPLAVA